MLKRVSVLLHLAVMTIFFSDLQAQEASSYPIIGNRCPNFILNDLNYFNNKQISLGSLKGTPFILDFFSIGCTSCFVSFPKVDEYKTKWGQKVQFILVGIFSLTTETTLRKSYEKYRRKYNLNLPVAYDSSVYKKFKISGVPHLIWVDKDGVVKAVTSTTDLTDENISAFLREKSFNFFDQSFDAKQKARTAFDFRKPYLVNENGGIDSEFIQRSLLSIWDNSKPTYMHSFDLNAFVRSRIPFQVFSMPLETLYRFAYFGRGDWGVRDSQYAVCHYSPVLELNDIDSTKFKSHWDENPDNRTKYCYSLVVTPDRLNAPVLQEIMQSDLKNFFGYEVSVEMRKMPYLKFVVSDPSKLKLKRKGGKPSHEISFYGLKCTNYPIKDFLGFIDYYAYLTSKNLPVLDETGIVDNIDIKIEAAMTDIDEIKSALQKEGYDLVEGEKEMQVIVIRNSKK